MRRLPSFERLAVITWVALYVNFCSGALVRVTNSGLGCPDWPLCNGRATPPFAGHAVIEFSNRLLAGTVIILTILLAIVGWKHWRGRLALAIAIGTFAQGPLGGITILVDLHPIAVASHFLLAIIVFTLATVLVIDTQPLLADRRFHFGEVERPAWLTPATLVFLALGLALIVSGAIVTTSSTHPGADNVQRLYSLLHVAYWHVRIAVAYVAALAVFLFAVSRLPDTPQRVPEAGVGGRGVDRRPGRDRRAPVAEPPAVVPRLGPRHDGHPAVGVACRARQIVAAGSARSVPSRAPSPSPARA